MTKTTNMLIHEAIEGKDQTLVLINETWNTYPWRNGMMDTS